MEHALAALGAAKRQRVVRPILELDIPTMWAIGNGDDARMLGAPGRPDADHKFKVQHPNLIKKGGRLKSTVREDPHPESSANRVRHAAQQVTGQRDGCGCPFAAVDPVPHWELQGPVVRKQDDEVNPVDLVVDANERELASRFRDAGEIDAQSQARMMFPLSRLKQEGPLNILQQGPARGGVPVGGVEEATEGTGTDGLRLVEDRLDVWIEEQTERSPEAALPVGNGRDGE